MFTAAMKKRILRSLAYICLFAATVAGLRGLFNRRIMAVLKTYDTKKAYVAIIIDDFGYNGEGTEEMLSLPIPFTAAIMPFCESSVADAERAKAAGKEIIIHMPMESLHGKREWVGEKGIFLSMTDEEIKSRLDEATALINGAVGLNNHMGSAIMEDKRALSIIINHAAENGLLFIDSMTTPNSKSAEICDSSNNCFLKRDVFLDSTDSPAHVKEQLKKAQETALKNGYAVAIGHVGPEGGKITAEAINEMYRGMQESGITFITVSEMKKLLENQ